MLRAMSVVIKILNLFRIEDIAIELVPQHKGTGMGCRRDVPERETANTNINPRILLYCVDIKNKMAFKRQLLTLFPQYLFILMFKMQFKACFKFCLIYFFE